MSINLILIVVLGSLAYFYSGVIFLKYRSRIQDTKKALMSDNSNKANGLNRYI